MKKIYLLFLTLLFSMSVLAQADAYSFSVNNGTYIPITGGTLINSSTNGSPSLDSYASGALTIPSFTFAGTSYTSMKVTSNGQIYFNLGTATAPSSAYDVLSASSGSNVLLAPFSSDMNQISTGVSEMRYETIGNEVIIQWSNFRRYAKNEVFDFQVRLNTVTGEIKYVYNGAQPFDTSTDYQPRIGIKSSTTNYLYLTVPLTGSWNTPSYSTVGIVSGSNCVFQGSLGFSSGLTYTFTPPVACTGTPLGGTITIPNQIICNNSKPNALVIPYSNPGIAGFTYQWEDSDDNGVTDPWANATGGSGASTLSYSPPTFTGTTNKYYRLKTTCTASSQFAYSNVHIISSTLPPNSPSNLSFTNISDGGMTISWTNGNANRRVVLVNTTNNFSTLNTSGPAYVQGTILSAGDLLIYDGTNSSINIIGMNCNTTYYFKVYEYLRCGSSAPYTYNHSASLDGNQSTIAFLTTPKSLPMPTSFTGFDGSNLTNILPGWQERRGNGTILTDSEWVESTIFTGIPSAKINLYTTSNEEWIVSPTFNVNAATRIKLKAAITDYDLAVADPNGMQGTDDKVQVMITSDICGAAWIPLFTFDASNTSTLTNVLTDFTIHIPSSYVGKNVRIGFKATDGPINDAPDYDFHIANVAIENTPPPTVTATKVDNVCYGGTIGTARAIPLDGTPPYTYSWAPSGGTSFNATGLAAGNYTITVTDANNLKASATVTINEPSIISGNPTQTNVSCNAGTNATATVNASGGTAPYTYLWDNGATTNTVSNLAIGTYTVTIKDANLCTVSEIFTITQPNVLSATATQNDATYYGGNDGNATVTPMGGTAPYSYLWSNGATTGTASNLIAGIYTVTVTDANGCTTSQSFTIIQPIPLMVQSVSQTNVSCHGGSDGTATINAMGGNAPYSYLWSPSGGTNKTGTGLTAGIHSVIVTDSTGNTITENFTITEPDVLTVTTGTITNVSCFGLNTGALSLTITGGTAPFSYKWSNGSIAPTADNLFAGTYTVKITDAKGCTATQSFIVTEPAVLTANQTTLTHVSCNGSADGLATVNVTGGTAPYTYLWSNNQTGTTISNLAGGTYTVTITDAHNCNATLSFTVIEPALVHPPVTGNQSFCVSQNAKVSDLAANGTNVTWYSSATGGTSLASTALLTNGTSYYASQTIGGCESPYRAPVLVTFIQTIPLTTTKLDICGNSNIGSISIDGYSPVQLKWYDSPTAAVPLSSNQIITSGTYYISTLMGSICESSRQAVQVSVLTIVPLPTAVAQTVCNGGTIADLIISTAPGATLRWYATPQSTIVLPSTTSLLTGTYYAEQIIGVCKSQRLAVPVQVTNVLPPAISSMTLCEGATVENLYLNSNTSKYVWFVNNTTTTPLANTYLISTGTYFIAQEVSGCISNRVQVSVTVNPRPGSPTGQEYQTFNFKATVSDLQMNQNNVAWFATYEDAMKQSNHLSKGTPLQDGVMYYGALIGANSCSSLPSTVTVTINLSIKDLDLAHLKYYPNPVDSELNISYIEPVTKVEIYTLLGQQIISRNFNTNDVKIDLSAISSGTYIVRIVTANASQFVKVVKK